MSILLLHRSGTYINLQGFYYMTLLDSVKIHLIVPEAVIYLVHVTSGSVFSFSKSDVFNFTLYYWHLADAIIQSDLHFISRYTTEG